MTKGRAMPRKGHLKTVDDADKCGCDCHANHNAVAVAASVDLAPADIPGRAALVELAMTLARQLDAGAGMATAAVSKELRAVLADLLPEKPDDDDDLTADLSAPVLHTS